MTTTTSTEIEQPLPLPATERCDRCGALALAVVFLPNGNQPERELLFCGHHYRENRDALLRIDDVFVNLHPVS